MEIEDAVRLCGRKDLWESGMGCSLASYHDRSRG